MTGSIMDTANQSVTPIWVDGIEYFVSGSGVLKPVIKGGAPDGEGQEGDAGATEGEGSEGTSTETEGEGSGDGKKFTQEEVNALIAREKSKATRGTMKPEDLGFKSKQEMEDFLTAAREKAKQDQTDAEKALEDAKKEAADGARAEVLTKAQEIMLKADWRLKATAAGVAPSALEDAYAVARLTEDWGEVKVDEDGNVEGLDDDFFKSFKEAKPYYFTPEQEGDGSSDDLGGGSRSTGDKGAADEKALRAKYPALNQGGRL